MSDDHMVGLFRSGMARSHLHIAVGEFLNPRDLNLNVIEEILGMLLRLDGKVLAHW
jgi:hypothetical protein